MTVTIPFNLQDPAFLSKWDSWVAFRKRFAKVGNWDAMFEEQLSFLARYAVPEAIEILSQSIRNGWRGLFELKGAPYGLGKGGVKFKKAGTVWEWRTRLDAIQARLRAINADNNSWVLVIHPDTLALINHLHTAKPEGWEARVLAARQSYRNYIRVGLKPALQEEFDRLVSEKSKLEQNLMRGQGGE